METLLKFESEQITLEIEGPEEFVQETLKPFLPFVAGAPAEALLAGELEPADPLLPPGFGPKTVEAESETASREDAVPAETNPLPPGFSHD